MNTGKAGIIMYKFYWIYCGRSVGWLVGRASITMYKFCCVGDGVGVGCGGGVVGRLVWLWTATQIFYAISTETILVLIKLVNVIHISINRAILEKFIQMDRCSGY